MSKPTKNTDQETVQDGVQDTGQDTPTKQTKTYIFPDIDGGGPSVTIEATSIEEATALFQKGQA